MVLSLTDKMKMRKRKGPKKFFVPGSLPKLNDGGGEQSANEKVRKKFI